ncbi:MAG: glycosyl transferase family 90 [Verrucomicrobiota bacterium]
MKQLHIKKLRFYIKHAIKLAVPRYYYEQRLMAEIARAAEYDSRELNERVDYYCKTNTPFKLPFEAKTYRDLSIQKLPSAPCLDLKQCLRYFPSKLRFECDFRDNLKQLRWFPPLPAFVKCRPIGTDNTTSVLMKLNSGRFFDFKKDRLAFEEKRAIAVFRGPCYREHRQIFVQKCYNLPRTDIGDTRKAIEQSPTFKPFLSPNEQLRNKFIISVEGNDVSSSLMWIMASNSMAFMTKPHFEGWFMQGELIPNHHYVLLRDDYADLPEKIDYYSRNTEEALRIISNAHKHVAQFFDFKREKLISILVAKKYFTCSGQWQM